MADIIRTLSTDDMIALREVIGAYRRTGAIGRNRYGPPIEDYPAPEVYIARTPSGGLPGLAEEGSTTGSGTGTPDYFFSDRPGYADCDIYRITSWDETPVIEPITGLFQRVYNIFDTVRGNQWVIVQRDKSGCWLANYRLMYSGARVYSSVDIALPAGYAITTLSYDQARWDTDGYHSTSSSSRITAPSSGFYGIGYQIHVTEEFGGGSTTIWTCSSWLRLNGSTKILVVEQVVQEAGAIPLDESPELSGYTEWYMNKGDYVEVQVQHNNALAHTIYVSPTEPWACELWIRRLGS